jgi:hypothetical protein
LVNRTLDNRPGLCRCSRPFVTAAAHHRTNCLVEWQPSLQLPLPEDVKLSLAICTEQGNRAEITAVVGLWRSPDRKHGTLSNDDDFAASWFWRPDAGVLFRDKALGRSVRHIRLMALKDKHYIIGYTDRHHRLPWPRLGGGFQTCLLCRQMGELLAPALIQKLWPRLGDLRDLCSLPCPY